MKSKINHLIVMGDSLSDRGTLSKRNVLGFIPMNTLSGLEAKKTPFGRFTNGYNWIDNIAQRLHNIYSQNENAIGEEKSMTLDDVKVSQAKKKQANATEKKKNHDLNNDRSVKFKGKVLLRSYAEGGLTSHNYTDTPVFPNSINIPALVGEEFSRLMISNLDEKRRLLLEDDEKQALSDEHKSHTLIFEWSGANDLITVNLEPSVTAINKSIASRIGNLKKLIKNGYRNFVLFNLPDLSLTPYYQDQSKSKALRDNAQQMSVLYNQKLKAALDCVQKEFLHSCQIELLDICQIFTQIYSEPQQKGFDQNKIKQYYTNSTEFKIKGNNASSKGYMFWDEIHPSEDTHKELADEAFKLISHKFELLSPTNESVKSTPYVKLLKEFSYKFDIYNKENKDAWFGIYSLFSYTTLSIDKNLSACQNLERIVHYAFTVKSYPILQIFKQLGWVDSSLKISNSTPVEILQIEQQRHESSEININIRR